MKVSYICKLYITLLYKTSNCYLYFQYKTFIALKFNAIFICYNVIRRPKMLQNLDIQSSPSLALLECKK